MSVIAGWRPWIWGSILVEIKRVDVYLIRRLLPWIASIRFSAASSPIPFSFSDMLSILVSIWSPSLYMCFFSTWVGCLVLLVRSSHSSSGLSCLVSLSEQPFDSVLPRIRVCETRLLLLIFLFNLFFSLWNMTSKDEESQFFFFNSGIMVLLLIEDFYTSIQLIWLATVVKM